MKNDSTAPGGKAAGMYAPAWPDRHQLGRMSQMASTALSSIRKPALALPFAATAGRLQEQVDHWFRMSDGQRTDDVAAALFATRKELVSEVRTYFARQRQFPFHKGMTIEHHRGIGAHDVDGLLLPGLHYARDWDEFANRFGTNERRRRNMWSLLAAMHLYKRAGSTAMDVGGSFVTTKINPGDIDCRADPEGMDATRLDSMLRVDDENLSLEDHRWRSHRRPYFGLDIGFAEQELHRRTFLEFMCEFPEEFGDDPPPRSVGVVRLDLRQPLPKADRFVPFTWHSQKYDEVTEEILDEARRRLPQHWQHISDEVLTSYGVRIIRQPWRQRGRIPKF